MPKKKRGCKLFTALLITLLALPCYAEPVNSVQKIKAEKSYLLAVSEQKEQSQIQEIIIKNSFLVFAKIRACTCNCTLQPQTK